MVTLPVPYSCRSASPPTSDQTDRRIPVAKMYDAVTWSKYFPAERNTCSLGCSFSPGELGSHPTCHCCYCCCCFSLPCSVRRGRGSGVLGRLRTWCQCKLLRLARTCSTSNPVLSAMLPAPSIFLAISTFRALASLMIFPVHHLSR